MFAKILREAWISISSYKTRTILTMLGIVIGVAAVVVMVAVGETVQNEITETFDSMGTNLIIIGPAETVSGGVRGGRGKPMVTFDEAESLKNITGIESVSYIVPASAQAVFGSNNYGVSVFGTNVAYLDTANWEIEKGQMFTEKDARAAKPYIVIGQTIVEELFGVQDPIGKTLRIKGKPFTVIGTLKEKGEGIGGTDKDNVVIMPVRALRQRLFGSNRPNFANVVFAKAVSEDIIESVAKKVKYELRMRHRLKDDVEDDFSINLMTEFVEKVRNVGTILSILLASIASISLVVGSIGIMNMMLVSVTERTREIGTRKALGAGNRWIMAQFLIEAIIISFIGSLVGMIFGIIISQIGGIIYMKEVPISIWSVVISMAVAVVVGIASGLTPALKAMKLDPIIALRFQ